MPTPPITFVDEVVSIPQEDPWNIKCSFCGHKWHVKGDRPEDINCFKCQEAAMIAEVAALNTVPTIVTDPQNDPATARPWEI